MARGKPHSVETKAAVIAELLAGGSVTEVARSHGVSKATVIGWRDAAGVGSTPVEPERQQSLAEDVYALVRDNVAALRAIASTALDADWRRNQRANELAIFAGVLSDKTFRVLAAIEAGQTNLEPTGAAAALDRGVPEARR